MVHEEWGFHRKTPEGSAARATKKKEEKVGCRQNFPRSGEITNFNHYKPRVVRLSYASIKSLFVSGISPFFRKMSTTDW